MHGDIHTQSIYRISNSSNDDQSHLTRGGTAASTLYWTK